MPVELLALELNLGAGLMERAGKTLSKLSFTDPEALARAAWPEAVGKRLANRAIVIGLVRDRLVVEVEDAIWQKQLFHLEGQILVALRKVVGDDLVRQIEFRIGRSRRPPQRATHSSGAAIAADDGDAIGDFVLRMVYKQSRKKASA